MTTFLHTALPSTEISSWVKSEYGLDFDSESGRWPTHNEVIRFCVSIPKFKVSFSLNSKSLPYQILLEDMRYPTMSGDGGRFGWYGVYALMNIEYDDLSNINRIWFESGCVELNVAILYALSRLAGPLIMIPGCGGPPLFINQRASCLFPIEDWIKVDDNEKWATYIAAASNFE